MRTFKKAKEIFNSQINNSSNETILSFQENRKSLQKFNSTLRLYKMYLYIKILQRGLKKLNLVSFFKTSKIKKDVYKLFLQLYKVSDLIQKQTKNLVLKKILKNYFFANTNNFTSKKSSFIQLNKRRQFKNLLAKFNFIIFSYFFEYKVSSLLKIRKNYSSLKKEIDLILQALKKSKIIFNVKNRLNTGVLSLKNVIEKLLINLRWSNKSFNKGMQRLQLVFCIYSIAFMIVFSNIFYCTSRYLDLQQNVNIAMAEARGNINRLIPADKRALFFLRFIQIIKSYSSIFSIFYISLFLKPKNTLKLPKFTTGHLGVCAIIGFMNFGLEISQMLVSYVVKSCVLFTDIYFSKLFIKGNNKLIFLSNFTDILTNSISLRSYYNSKLFKSLKIFQFESIDSHGIIYPINKLVGEIRNADFQPGRYEKFIETILSGIGEVIPNANLILLNSPGKYLKSYVHLPFYLIILITLVYNCSYYIIYNKQPYIPIVTDLVKKLTPNNQND